MKVRTEKLGQIAVLHLRGRIVVGTEIQKLQAAVLAQSESSAVVLDLQHVTRMDAAGLGMLLELRAAIQSTGREFRLMNVTKLVQQVLEITSLDSVFERAVPGELKLVERESAGEAKTQNNSELTPGLVMRQTDIVTTSGGS